MRLRSLRRRISNMVLRIEDDLDIAKIAESGQCFRWEAIDPCLNISNEGGSEYKNAAASYDDAQENPVSYRVPVGQNRLYITDLGNDNYEIDCSDDEYESIWKPYLDLDISYRAIRKTADDGTDTFMKAACDDQQGIRILRQDPWETTVSFIISQNRNIPAIKKSIELLCEAAGDEIRDCRGEKFFAFPGPEKIAALSEEALDECKLGYRKDYVRRIAEDVCSGSVDLAEIERMNEDDAFKALTGIYGIGPKVASCINLFGLHHLNAFPIDTWIKRILAAEYPEGYPYEKYAPYNGIFQQYMFAYYRNNAISIK